MKIIIIFVLVLFLLATGGAFILYLSQPTPKSYEEAQQNKEMIDTETGVQYTGDIEEFTGSLEEFRDE